MIRPRIHLASALVLVFLSGCAPEPGLVPGPSFSINSHQSGDTAVGPYLSLVGTAADGFGVDGVYVELDGGGFGKSVGTTRWCTNVPGLTNGPHVVRAFVKNIGGLTSQTDTVNITFTTNTNWFRWTVLVYLDGDNNLEYNAQIDFNEMEAGILDAVNAGGRESLTNMAVVALFDRMSTPTRLYRILPDPDTGLIASERLDTNSAGRGHLGGELGEMNMGDTNTLRFFLEYAKTNYPASHYVLVLWDHGTGARSICQDWTSLTDALYIDQVHQAIAASTNTVMPKVDVIGFDACFMGMAEVAYEFRGVADVMAASMRVEDSDGWDYQTLFGRLYGSRSVSSLTAPDFGSLVVETYRDWHESRNHNRGDTQSAIDLSIMPALKTKLDALAAAIYVENKQVIIQSIRDVSINFFNNTFNASVDIPNYDIYDFCNRIVVDTTYGFSAGLKTAASDVISSLAGGVISAYGGDGYGQIYYYGPGSTVKHGLSIFFSRGDTNYNNSNDTTISHPLKSTNGTVSHFWFQWWYTSTNVSDWWAGHYDGNLDFCDSDLDGTVETWRELLKAWYDPATNVNTPGSY